MAIIGNPIVSTDFPKDTFSGNGSTTAFTMQIAPASVNSVIVVVSGITQDPSTYTISGTTLTFSAAPPTGTNNISVRHLGVAGIPQVPATGSVTSSSLAVGAITSALLPAGSVLQVVSGSNSTQFSTSSTSWTATPITASITPKSATSKIYVSVTYCVYGTGQMTINRGATNLGNSTYGFLELNNSNAFEWTAAYSYLDFPATTSSTTYTVYVKATSPYSVWTNINPTVSTITLMEIAA